MTNEKTQEIEAEILMDNAADDAAIVDELLDQTKNRTKTLGGDGAYDKWNVCQTLDRRGIMPIIPPRRNAKIKRNGNSKYPPFIVGDGDVPYENDIRFDVEKPE
jgi:hypothetical protein